MISVAGIAFNSASVCFAQAVMRRCQPKPGLLHIIACSDQRECLGGARILLAQTGGADRQGDLGVAGRQTLRILIVAQCSGNLAAQQCGSGRSHASFTSALRSLFTCVPAPHGVSRRHATERLLMNPCQDRFCGRRAECCSWHHRGSRRTKSPNSRPSLRWRSRREAAAVFGPIQAMLFGPRPPACETPVMAR